MSDDLNSYEIEVLKMLAGTREPTWGAWVGACLEVLTERGYATRGPKYKITEEGQKYLEAESEQKPSTAPLSPDIKSAPSTADD